MVKCFRERITVETPKLIFRVLDTLIDPVQLLGIDRSTMRQFAMLRGRLPRQIRTQLGDVDLLFAATALEHDRMLLTGNVKNFQHIPGLEVANDRPS